MNQDYILLAETSNSLLQEKTGLTPKNTNEKWWKEKINFPHPKSLDEFKKKLNPFWGAPYSLGFYPASFKPKAIFFDMDSTLIHEECLDELSKLHGCFAKVKEKTELTMSGEICFDSSLEYRVSLLKGMKEELLYHLEKELNIFKGAFELVKGAHEKNIATFIISGGFHPIADQIARRLKIKTAQANTLAVENGLLLGKLGSGKRVSADFKATWLIEQCQKLKISPHEAIAVGDGANDIPMLKTVGLSVGFNPKKKLYPHLDIFNHSGDHRMLLAVLEPS